MPTIQENLAFWDGVNDWSRQGDEWSRPWGGTELEWWGSIFPRLRTFLPAGVVLEIAPGFGRWTQFLVGLSHRLILVDLSERCIEACKQRFSASSHVTYHVNDGVSLAMVPNGSVDFVFSFDSLVHVDAKVLRGYLEQLSLKLTDNGVGFIHHSNLGAYPRGQALARALPWRLRQALVKAGWLVSTAWRDENMTAELFATFCTDVGLQCISQEKINWVFGRHLIDCFSVFTPKGSVWARPNRIVENPRFMEEAQLISRYGRLYSLVPRLRVAEEGNTISSPVRRP